MAATRRCAPGVRLPGICPHSRLTGCLRPAVMTLAVESHMTLLMKAGE